MSSDPIPNKQTEDPLQNIDAAEEWQEFLPLGDWVKQVPMHIKILWASSIPEEVENARSALLAPFPALKQEFAEQNDKDKEKLLVQCLIAIIPFCWAVLKKSATIQKGQLFRALLNTAKTCTIKLTKTFEWNPSAEFHLYKGTEFIGELIASAKDDLLMLQCCAVAVVRYKEIGPRDREILPPLLEALAHTSDDRTRAFFLCAISELIKRSFSIDKRRTQELRDSFMQYLSLPEPLSATRLMAAAEIAAYKTDQAPIKCVNLLADYMLAAKEMEEYFAESQLDFLQFSKLVPASVISRPPICGLFLDRCLANLKQLDTLNSHNLMTGGKLVVQYALTERLAEGIKIIDLPANTVKVLKHLAQLNHVWTLPKFTALLDKCGIPASKEALQKFIEDTDDGGVKRFPTFAGIDDIAWQDLHHAYGAATDVPELLRLLSSLNSESHGYALEALNSTILHQGSVFPATPYVVPYLLEMLECAIVQGKADILIFCRDLLVLNAAGVFASPNGFDVDVAHADQEDEEDAIKRKIEAHLIEGLPIIITQLTTAAQGVTRACASYLLAVLPRVAAQTVPLIQQQLLVESDVPAEAAMTLSLGIILQKVHDRETCLKYFQDRWTAVKDTTKSAVKFCTAACIARLHYNHKLPAFVLDELMRALNDETPGLVYYDFDDAASITMSMLTHLNIDDISLPLIIKRFKRLEKMLGNMPTIRTMMSIAFRFAKESDKAPNPATITALQLDVLQALVDSDQIWRYGNACNLLNKLGLPNSRNSMLEFIEKAKAHMDIVE